MSCEPLTPAELTLIAGLLYEDVVERLLHLRRNKPFLLAEDYDRQMQSATDIQEIADKCRILSGGEPIPRMRMP